jgi:hypothetical protein
MIIINIERELGYDAMYNTDHLRLMNRFFIFKVQMINLTVQNDFRINI